MELLNKQINRCAENMDDASLVIETILLGMRTIRRHICNKCTSDLTVPQFRVLAYLNYHKGASLSAVAEHLELSLPSMSKTIDCLVKRNLVAREISSNDRRRITLELTTAGIKAFETIREDTRKHFSEMLSTLSEEDREKIVQAMHMLQAILKPSEKSSSMP